MEITATELKNNLGIYLRECRNSPVYVTKNGKVAAKLVDYRYDLAIDKAEFIREATPTFGEQADYYSYEAFLKMTEDSDERYELIDGEVFMLASPKFDHQYALMVLIENFSEYFKGKSCRPMAAPLDIELDRKIEGRDKCVVQPDLMVLCDWKDNINKDGKYKGTPTLVVEILSPATKRHDLVRKLDLYTHTEIKEYWILDPVEKSVMIYKIEDRAVTEFSVCKHEDICKSFTFDGLNALTSQLFM